MFSSKFLSLNARALNAISVDNLLVAVNQKSGLYSIYYVRNLGIAFKNGCAKLEGSKSW